MKFERWKVHRKRNLLLNSQVYAKAKKSANQYNFEQFAQIVESAGFISPKLLSSRATLAFVYTLFLILQQSYTLTRIDIMRYTRKWLVLSTLTGRYNEAPELKTDCDLQEISSKGFALFLEEVEETLLSDSFWGETLVRNLMDDTSSSPLLNTYLAAQVFFGDRVLLSNSVKVADLIIASEDVHPIFSKQYLRENALKGKMQYRQAANYAIFDTGSIPSIGKKSPHEFFSSALDQCNGSPSDAGSITDTQEFWENLKSNCIPHDVVTMTADNYPVFLQVRCEMMAAKIRDFYYSL